MLLVELVIIPLFWILFNLQTVVLMPQVFDFFIGNHRFLRAGHRHVGVNLTRSGSRTVASIGALSADDSGHSGNDPVLGAVLRMA